MGASGERARSAGRAPAAKHALHGVLVTYRRPADLADMLQRLAEQDRQLDTLLVVDNDPDESARPVIEAARRAPAGLGATRLTYLATASNLGPAGGIAAGMRQVLPHAGDDDWVVPLDDDDPPPSHDLLAELERFAEHLREQHPDLGAVGMCGARFEPGLARSVRVPDDELVGSVPSDWIGGNGYPFYSVRAIRSVGVFDDRLFFGFDDLEYGLRMSGAGFPIFAHGGLWRLHRTAVGRLDMTGVPARTLGASSWRRYYSLRNLIYILRKHGHPVGAARLAARGVAKPLYNLPRQPALAARHLSLNARAIADGYRGRMGLTVPPVPKVKGSPP